MFLKKVYRHSKLLFAGMLFFMLMQLFVFYKGGMVFSPWFNYGMFSERLKPQQRYNWFGVANTSPTNRLLSPQKDDKIFVTVDKFLKLPENDSLYEHDIQRLFRKVMLPEPSIHHYICHVDAAAFKNLFSAHFITDWQQNNIHQFQYIYLYATPISAIWNNEILIIDTTSSPWKK